MPFKQEVVYTPGWDAGARSVAVLVGDGAASFEMGDFLGCVCGFNDVDNGAAYGEIDHAFFIEVGQVRVIEKGIFKTAKIPLPSPAVFRLQRLGGTVSYYLNDTLIYTSATPSVGVVFLDCSLYAYGDAILWYSIEELVGVAAQLSPLRALGSEMSDFGAGLLTPLKASGEVEADTTVSATLAPLIAVASDVADFCHAVLPALRATAEDDYQVSYLVPLKATGYDAEYTGAYAVLPALKTTGYDFDEKPDFAVVHAVLPALASYGVAELAPASGSASLAPLYSLGVETDDAFAVATLAPLQTDIWVGESNYFVLSWPIVTIQALQSSAEVELVIPAPDVYSEGTVSQNGVFLTIPAPLVEAVCGGLAVLEVPAPSLVAEGTVLGWASVSLEMPEPVVDAVVLTGNVASIQVTIPAPQMESVGGGRVELEMPAPLLEAVGWVEGLSEVVLLIPAPELTATATVTTLASVLLEMPAPVLYAGDGNRISLVMPAPILTASATSRIFSQDQALAAARAAVLAAEAALAAATTEAAVLAAKAALAAAWAEEAAALEAAEATYAVNVETGAVTMLVLGAMDKLVTAHGKLYGLQGGALVRLDGEVDGEHTPIPVRVRFAPTDFGTNALKRLNGVYLSVRENDGITMDVVTDEVKAYRYQTRTDNAPAYGTHKVVVGAGPKFHTVGLVVRNRDGGRFALGGLDAQPQVLSRKPR